MPRPKKSSLPKQKTNLLSLWQPRATTTGQVHDAPAPSNTDSSVVPQKRSLSPAESSIQTSDHAKKVTCLVPQGHDSGPDALTWSGGASVAKSGHSDESNCLVPQGLDSDLHTVACSSRDLEGGTSVPRPQVLNDEAHQVLNDEVYQDLDDEVSIYYESSDDELGDEDEITAEADLTNKEDAGNSTAAPYKCMIYGDPIDLASQEDPYDQSADEGKGKAPMRTFDLLSNEWQLISTLRGVLVFLKQEAFSMNDMLEWPVLDQPLNERTWKLLRTESVDSLVDSFNAAIPVETKRVFEQRKIRKTDLLSLRRASGEKRSGIYVGICERSLRPIVYCGCSRNIHKRCKAHFQPSRWRYSPFKRIYQRLLQGDSVLFCTLAAFNVPVERAKLELIEGLFMLFLRTKKYL